MGMNPLKVGLGLTLVAALVWAPACSSDEDDDGSGTKPDTGSTGGTGGTGGGTGGTSGTGGGDASVTTIQCGSLTCSGSALPAEVASFTGGVTEIPACCAEGDKCGLDTALLAALNIEPNPVCQPKDQPGELDANCPSQDISGVVQVQGCCRPDGVCGYMVDQFDVLTFHIDIGLGCVDGSVVPDAGPPVPCGAGTGGTGGTGGTAGASAGGAAGGGAGGAAGGGGQAGAP